MQRFRNVKKADIIAGINVTPLVDITLVLLIIFMVTATYIAKLSIPLELPKAGSGKATDGKLMSVLIGAKGQLYLNGQDISDQALAEEGSDRQPGAWTMLNGGSVKVYGSTRAGEDAGAAGSVAAVRSLVQISSGVSSREM